MEQDIISQMTIVDWLLVAVVLALVALTLYIIYLAVEDPIKNFKAKRERERRRAEREAAAAAAAEAADEGQPGLPG